MSLKKQIRSRIAEFDRRSPTILGETEAKFGRSPGYVAALVALVGDGEAPVSSGATWLIKSHLESGGRLSESQCAQLWDQLELLEAWDAQLHLCQSVQLLTLKPNQAALLADWLMPLLEHSRPFLRAWSLDALCRVAAAHPSFRGPAHEALTAGLKDGSASVRARARRLQNEVGELKG